MRAMGSKRRGTPIHGWLVVDKPADMTSAGAVAKVRRLTGAAKVGHAGTLDPLATGILPLALGEATKTVSYVMDESKDYHFTIRWGEARASDDGEGEVTAVSQVRPSEAKINAILDRFTGTINQVPPVYSAVKVGGRRAYALARADAAPELQPRRVRIDRLVLIDIPDDDHARFEAVTGKGAYMRSLARDMAIALGTVGYVSALRRTRVGPFTEDLAISLDNVEELGHSAALLDRLLPVETALDDIPALALTEAEAWSLRNGRPVPVLPVASRSPLKNVAQDAVVCAMAGGKPVALARIKGGEIRPLRVLNL